jgi:tryptophan-rich sensory protein
MSAFGFIWVAIEVVALIDVFRHSSADWAYADRNRPFWVIFILFFGLIFVIPYLFVVRPRFPSKEATQVTDAFRKR